MKLKLAILFTFVAVSLFGQVKVGALVSYNISMNAPETVNVSNQFNVLTSKAIYKGTSNSTGFGLLGQYTKGNLYARGEAIYSAYTQSYEFTSTSIVRSKESKAEEKYKHIDLNVMAGIKLGNIRVGVGPNIKALVNHETTMTNITGYNAKDMRKLRYGVIGNIGLDLGRFHIDARYIKNFGKITDHVNFYNKSAKFKSKLHSIQLVMGITI